MIGITTTTANTDGAFILYQATGSTMNDETARIAKTATLDGGVVLVHSGVSDGDRSFTINAKMTESESEKLLTVFRNETLVIISTEDGVFSGAIQSYNSENGFIKIVLTIKARLSA